MHGSVTTGDPVETEAQGLLPDYSAGSPAESRSGRSLAFTLELLFLILCHLSTLINHVDSFTQL